MMTDPYTILLAPNPSLMTGSGTNTIILGDTTTGAMVIDPGHDDPTHLETIIHTGNARGGLQRILITHGHPDHTGGATTLRERLNIPIYAFSQQSVPIADHEITDSTTFQVGNDTLRAIHTPGHSSDHLCYLLEQQQILFGGDIVAGAGTIVIAPPGGDMQHYLDSLRHLQSLELREIVPGHGPIITKPQKRLTQYITHRLQREQQILQALQAMSGKASIVALVDHIYANVDERLHRVAALSVEAHLLKLEREGGVVRVGSVEEVQWQLVRE